MAVLVSSPDVLGIVDVHHIELVKSDHFVKFIKYAVKLRKVISGIMSMTGVESDPDVILQSDL